MTKPIAPTGPAFTGPADLIIGCGSHIFAAEVERILTAYPVVQDTAVMGIPGAEFGQRVAVFVQLERGVRRSVIDELVTSVTRLLADHKVAESLEVVQEIPRDHLGRIDHHSLLTMISVAAINGNPVR